MTERPPTSRWGVDPTRATLYCQSDVPEVTELMWLLMTVTGMGLLERGVSHKEKKEMGIANWRELAAR